MTDRPACLLRANCEVNTNLQTTVNTTFCISILISDEYRVTAMGHLLTYYAVPLFQAIARTGEASHPRILRGARQTVQSPS